MPPKSKFTREEIIAAALEIASEKGIEAVTARAVGEKLGSSARPIFTVFKNMDEVASEVRAAARKLYNGYICEGLKRETHFKGVGEAYIKFAVEQPKLFQLLFMSEQPFDSTLNSLPAFDDNYESILSSITNQYEIDTNSALFIYRHLWVYTHGIASMCATKTLTFGKDEISGMMTDVFVALLLKKKSEIEKEKGNNVNDQNK